MPETFRAEPLRTENSWRVVSSWGKLMGNRMSREDAERLALDLNTRAYDGPVSRQQIETDF